MVEQHKGVAAREQLTAWCRDRVQVGFQRSTSSHPTYTILLLEWLQVGRVAARDGGSEGGGGGSSPPTACVIKEFFFSFP
jgi:hypothetical protein